MTKKKLKEYCNEIVVWSGWLNKYREFVPKFINEAKTKNNWQDWDKDIFYEFFERSSGQCVSSLQQGYFTKSEQDIIKTHWNEISPLLKTIAENQEKPEWNIYKEIKKKIRKHTIQNRKAATNRLVASLQPNLLCTVVNESDLADLISKINSHTSTNISFEGDWFERSYNVCQQFQQELQPENPMDIATYPWQLLEHFRKTNSSLIEKQKQMESIIKLLETNKNLILTGAPGSGKTYKTAEIAVALIDGANKLPNTRVDLMKRYKELLNAKQIAFTTFHQSLDYEEFVEGLKPDIADDGTGRGTFSVKSGIFRTICQFAKKKFENSQKPAETVIKEKLVKEMLESFFDESMSDNKEFDYDSTKQKSGINTFELIPHNDDNYFYADIKNNQSMKQQRIVKEEMLSVLLNENKITKPTDIKKIFNTRYKYQYTFMYLLLNELRDRVKDINQKDEKEDLVKKEELKNVVLIIDEINRGNISKIFGELITLLEKDKRLDEENEITVTLPYSQDTFGVPSNLYIIGTMNTADRSIGHIDYAIRRRFSFLLLKSDKNVISSYDKYDVGVKEKAEILFDEIKDFISSYINADLNADDLMIGHSYFLCKTTDDLKIRLDSEIIPLIEEYEKDGIIMLDKSEMITKFIEWRNILS